MTGGHRRRATSCAGSCGAVSATGAPVSLRGPFVATIRARELPADRGAGATDGRAESSQKRRGSLWEPLRTARDHLASSCQRLRLGTPRPEDLGCLFLEPRASSRKRKCRGHRAREHEQSVPDAMTPTATHSSAGILEVVEHRAEVLSELLVSGQRRVGTSSLDFLLELVAGLRSVCQCSSHIGSKPFVSTNLLGVLDDVTHRAPCLVNLSVSGAGQHDCPLSRSSYRRT